MLKSCYNHSYDKPLGVVSELETFLGLHAQPVKNWHERAAFQRSSFGRSRSGGRLLAMT